MRVIELKADKRILGNFDVTYTVNLPDYMKSYSVLAFPPADIGNYDLSMVNYGPMDVTQGWVYVKYNMKYERRGTNKLYTENDVVVRFVVLDEGIEDYNQPDYDEE